MASIPKKVLDRFNSQVGRFQKILQAAKDRDINEADTVLIVTDIIADLFGFEKYIEITSEFAIRSTYCDLAIRTDGAVKYLVEVKAIGLALKDPHLRQALDYGANHGIEWIVLTNGIRWQIHKILFEKPIASEAVCTFDLLALSPRKKEDQETLFLLCKEGLNKAAIEEFHEHRQIVNRFILASILLSSPVLEVARREMKRLSPGIPVDLAEIESILKNDVLKREVQDCEEAARATSLIRRAATRALRKRQEKMTTPLTDISIAENASEVFQDSEP